MVTLCSTSMLRAPSSAASFSSWRRSFASASQRASNSASSTSGIMRTSGVASKGTSERER